MGYYKPQDIRVLLSRIESAMSLWAKGYEEITPHLLDQLLPSFTKATTIAEGTSKETLHTMLQQLVNLQSTISRSEPVNNQVAQKLAQEIIEDIHEMRHASMSTMKPVEVEDLIGAQVRYLDHLVSTIGQVVRFQPAGRQKRRFGFMGTIIIRPADEQKAMKALFQEIYLTRSDDPFFFGLYHWSPDLPIQTFLEPGRRTDLVTAQWVSHQVQNDDEDEGWEDEATSIPEDTSLVKTIEEGDRRIGVRAFSIREEASGHLDRIEVYADGTERWTSISDGGKRMMDESNLFWLEVSGYQRLFPARVLSQHDIYNTLQEALALYKGHEEMEDLDEIIQLQRQLDGILKFLNGDLEDGIQKRITTAYQGMLWGSISLNAAQHKVVVRQTAIIIDQLRKSS